MLAPLVRNLKLPLRWAHTFSRWERNFPFMIQTMGCGKVVQKSLEIKYYRQFDYTNPVHSDFGIGFVSRQHELWDQKYALFPTWLWKDTSSFKHVWHMNLSKNRFVVADINKRGMSARQKWFSIVWDHPSIVCVGDNLSIYQQRHTIKTPFLRLSISSDWSPRTFL